jgi:hypothetical protein
MVLVLGGSEGLGGRDGLNAGNISRNTKYQCFFMDCLLNFKGEILFLIVRSDYL